MREVNLQIRTYSSCQWQSILLNFGANSILERIVHNDLITEA